MSNGSRQRWFSQILQSGLEQNMFEPSQVLLHVTPEVMAHNLPPDVMSKVLQISLAAGQMTPERVLETLSPDLLAEHIPHEVLWECVMAAAEREGLTKSKGGGA